MHVWASLVDAVIVVFDGDAELHEEEEDDDDEESDL